MKRRGFLGSLLPSRAQGYAFGGGALQCVHCLYVMPVDLVDGVPVTYCCNEHCTENGVRYRYPLIQLERV